MAHVRRKFMELYRMNGSPGAKEALKQIRALYIPSRPSGSVRQSRNGDGDGGTRSRRWRRSTAG